MPNSKGFTLIELLIVISIIAILSVIGMVAYGSFLKSSRDARRQSDLKLIQSALEEYHSDLIFYPTATITNGVTGMRNLLSSGGSFDSSIGVGNGTAPATTKTYLNAIPQDPTPSTTTPYCYTAAPSGCTNSSASRCTSYTLYAKLENPPSGAGPYTCGSVSTYNLQVTPP